MCLKRERCKTSCINVIGVCGQLRVVRDIKHTCSRVAVTEMGVVDAMNINMVCGRLVSCVMCYRTTFHHSHTIASQG